MGTWENNQNALREYANTLRGGIPSNYKNISNVALGSMINAAWARQAQEEAEKKRLLEVQRQKDEDAAKERQYKLKKMQYELDDIENARNNRNLLNTLAPYKPSFGFDSDTGENVATGSTPLDPIVQATANAAGLNLLGLNGLQDTKSQMTNKALEDSVKAMSLYSSDPQKYKELSEKQKPMKDSVFTDEQILSLMPDVNDDDETRMKKNEELSKLMEPSRQKGIMSEDVLSGVLPPYEFSYQMRNKPIDVYKKEKDYDRSIYNADTGLAKAQVGADAKVSAAGIKAKAQVDSANTKANAGVEQTKIKTKGSILKEFIRGYNKYKTVKLTNEQKEKLAKQNIDAKRFSEMTSLYLKAYDNLKYENPNETDENIRSKAQATLIKAYKFTKEQLLEWHKGFNVLNEPEETTKSTPQKDIKADAYDVLINN